MTTQIEIGTENNNGVTAVPQKYTHGELTKENQVYYWCITILMVSLPIAYIVIASFMVAKLYYKWKLQIPLEHLKKWYVPHFTAGFRFSDTIYF